MLTRRLLILVLCASVGVAVVAEAPPAWGATAPRLRVVDYAPVDDPVGEMWALWNPTVVQSDLSKIAALHANAVAVFTPFDSCYPSLCTTDQHELANFVSMANADGLKVWLILYRGGAPSVSDAESYVNAVITPFRGLTNEIAALEVYSEIIPFNDPVGWQQWAQAIIPAAHAAAGGIPVTISAAAGDNPPNTNFQTLVTGLESVGVEPDFYDYHYYYDPASTETILQQAITIAGSVPLVVGETGMHSDCYQAYLGGCSNDPRRLLMCGTKTYPKTISGGIIYENAQSKYLAAVEAGTATAGLGAAGVWTLNDQPQSCTNMRAPFTLFGLYRPNGSAKPAAQTVMQAFIAAGG